MVLKGTNEPEAIFHLRDTQVHNDNLGIALREKEKCCTTGFGSLNLMTGVLQNQPVETQELAIVVH